MLEAIHGPLDLSDPNVESHVRFLQTLPTFGITDHKKVFEHEDDDIKISAEERTRMNEMQTCDDKTLQKDHEMTSNFSAESSHDRLLDFTMGSNFGNQRNYFNENSNSSTSFRQPINDGRRDQTDGAQFLDEIEPEPNYNSKPQKEIEVVEIDDEPEIMDRFDEPVVMNDVIEILNDKDTTTRRSLDKKSNDTEDTRSSNSISSESLPESIAASTPSSDRQMTDIESSDGSLTRSLLKKLDVTSKDESEQESFEEESENVETTETADCALQISLKDESNSQNLSTGNVSKISEDNSYNTPNSSFSMSQSKNMPSSNVKRSTPKSTNVDESYKENDINILTSQSESFGKKATDIEKDSSYVLTPLSDKPNRFINNSYDSPKIKSTPLSTSTDKVNQSMNSPMRLSFDLSYEDVLETSNSKKESNETNTSQSAYQNLNESNKIISEKNEASLLDEYPIENKDQSVEQEVARDEDKNDDEDNNADDDSDDVIEGSDSDSESNRIGKYLAMVKKSK